MDLNLIIVVVAINPLLGFKKKSNLLVRVESSRWFIPMFIQHSNMLVSKEKLWSFRGKVGKMNCICWKLQLQSRCVVVRVCVRCFHWKRDEMLKIGLAVIFFLSNSLLSPIYL